MNMNASSSSSSSSFARFIIIALSPIVVVVAFGCVGDDPGANATPQTTECFVNCNDGGGGPPSEAGPNQKLAITKLDPAAIDLALGASAKVKVTIDRSSGVTAPVTLTVNTLPKGVTAPSVTIAEGAFEGELTFTAASDAAQQKAAPTPINAKASTGETATKDLMLSVRGAPGTLDFSFGIGGTVIHAPTAADDTASCVVIDAQGRIYVAGTVADAATTAMATARFTSDGVLDPTWGQGGKTTTKPPGSTKTTGGGCMLDAKGLFVVVGSATSGAGETDFAIARFKTGVADSGTLDATFGASGIAIAGEAGRDDQAFGVAQVGATNEDIIVVGKSNTTIYAVQMDAVASAISKSAPATGGTYDGPPLATGVGVARGASTQVLVSGAGTGFSSATTSSAIFWPIGPPPSFNASFGNSPHYGVTTFGTTPFTGGRLAVQADKKPLIVGGTDQIAILRFVPGFPAFVLDPDFGGGKVTIPVGSGASAGVDVAVQADGKIIVAATALGDLSDFAVVRIDATGALDATFGTGGKSIAAGQAGADDHARAMALMPDGRIVVVGDTKKPSGTSDWELQRFWP